MKLSGNLHAILLILTELLLPLFPSISLQWNSAGTVSSKTPSLSKSRMER